MTSIPPSKEKYKRFAVKMATNPSVSKMTDCMRLVKNLKYSGWGCPSKGNGGRLKRRNKQKGVMD